VIEGGYIQARAAFQAYTVAPDHMASPIPDTMSFERASVLPLGLSTAACGLFQKDHLALQYPSATPAPTGQALLIWGGSTSVGANAIQLAVAAGYDVITTASPRNFDYVRGLGASQVFDYNAKTVVKDITKALTGKTLAGALAIGATSGEACVDIVGASRGVKFVSLASFAVSFADLSDGPAMPLQFASKIPGMAARGARLWLKSKTKGVRTNFIFGSSLATNEVGPLIYRDFLPQALADGRLVPAPPPHLVGEGLAYDQTALDLQKKGVSASKLVVSL
jgi:NADPH:quinone reductase-like Zn-dependent oxidoreductase